MKKCPFRGTVAGIVTSLSLQKLQDKISIFSDLEALRKSSAILQPVVMTIAVPQAYGHSVVQSAGPCFRVFGIGVLRGEDRTKPKNDPLTWGEASHFHDATSNRRKLWCTQLSHELLVPQSNDIVSGPDWLWVWF
jgi:hypothetical protein